MQIGQKHLANPLADLSFDYDSVFLRDCRFLPSKEGKNRHFVHLRYLLTCFKITNILLHYAFLPACLGFSYVLVYLYAW